MFFFFSFVPDFKKPHQTKNRKQLPWVDNTLYQKITAPSLTITETLDVSPGKSA